jgi:hypothetical protein
MPSARKFIYRVLACAAVILMIGVSFYSVARADDGGPNQVFWVKDQKITCVSIGDPSILAGDSFFVFDYSPAVGQKLGRPWAIMEAGKCYQMDADGGNVYEVSSALRQEFENTAGRKPTDEVADAFCNGDSCNNIFPESGPQAHIPPIQDLELFSPQGVDSQRSDVVYATGIQANEVFPTKYDLGLGATSFEADLPAEVMAIVSYQPFQDASKLYETLARDLQDKLQACDTRTRVEYQLGQLTFGGSQYAGIKNIVWGLSDGTKAIFDASADIPPLDAIAFMGCRTAFSQYLQAHAGDFATIDRLVGEVLQKYPDALSIDASEAPIIKRDPAMIDKILAFGDLATAASTTLPDISTATAPATPLEEPTPGAKLDMLFHSQNWLVRWYVLLPLLALIGIVLFIFIRRRKK